MWNRPNKPSRPESVGRDSVEPEAELVGRDSVEPGSQICFSLNDDLNFQIAAQRSFCPTDMERRGYNSRTSATIASVNFARTRLISRPNLTSRGIEAGFVSRYVNSRA